MRRLPLFIAALAVAAPLQGQDRPTVRAGAQYVFPATIRW